MECSPASAERMIHAIITLISDGTTGTTAGIQCLVDDGRRTRRRTDAGHASWSRHGQSRRSWTGTFMVGAVSPDRPGFALADSLSPQNGSRMSRRSRLCAAWSARRSRTSTHTRPPAPAEFRPFTWCLVMGKSIAPPVFGVGPEADSTRRHFVIRNAYTGGSDNLKKSFESAQKHRATVYNEFCGKVLDYDRGDDVIQIGIMDLRVCSRLPASKQTPSS